MKLLQNSWSDMLVLDHLHHRIHNNLPDETALHNGQKFDLLGLGLLGVPLLAERFNEIQNKLIELKFDVGDYICMKFLLLLNPGECKDTFYSSLCICLFLILEFESNCMMWLLQIAQMCAESATEKPWWKDTKMCRQLCLTIHSRVIHRLMWVFTLFHLSIIHTLTFSTKIQSNRRNSPNCWA